MRKLITIVLVVMMMACLFSNSAYAANPTYSIQWIEAYKSGTPGTSDYREAFTVSIYVDSGSLKGNTLKVEWYKDASTLLGATTLKAQPFEFTGGSVSCNGVISGKPSGSWDTVWYQPADSSNLPQYVVVYIDGVDVATGGTVIAATPGIYDSLTTPKMPFAVMNNGVVAGYYNTIDEAVANAPTDSTIKIRQSGDYTLPDGGGKKITFDNASGGAVSFDMQNGNNNYSDVDFGADVVVNNPPQNFDPAGPDAPAAPAAPAAQNKHSVPSTGDDSNVALWAVLLFGFAAVALTTRKRKAN